MGQEADGAEVSAKNRLVDFARRRWRNRAFWQMTHGMFCPKHAYCQTASLDAPQTFRQPGTLDLLKNMQDLLSTYTAVRT